MRIALIGDVHANLSALEAVLEHARSRRIEAIWNVGDFVGYGPFPEEVVKRLRRECAVGIVGNYDLKVLAFEKKREKWRSRKQVDKFLGFQWAAYNLSEESREYLSSLPEERELGVEGQRVLLTHGSPASNKEYIGPDTPVDRLSELATGAGADVIVSGHSHRPFVRRVDRTCFVNTGSVGRPDDGDSRACYAILEIAPRGSDPRLRVQHYRVGYDVQATVAAIRAHRLPEQFAQMLIQGRDLDGVTSNPQTWASPATETLPWDEAESQLRMEAVLHLAERCRYEAEHTHHVAHLSLRLFDELQLLHRLGPQERFWLRCAALLHDIGWIEGQRGHHKASLRLILDAPDLPFDDRERQVVGSTARYHRRALPRGKHDHFAMLSPVDQHQVTILAALLRVADGLDATHRGIVEDLACRFSPRHIVVSCVVRSCPLAEREQALDKGDLLEHAFGRELLVEW